MLSHEKSTRNNNALIEILRVKLEVAKQSFYFAGAKIFNSLPMKVCWQKILQSLGHLFLTILNLNF